MASFDVESLFTNVPTKETIELILDLAFAKDNVFHGLERKDLKKLLTICTQESHFQSNGVFYDQVDGVSMGVPLDLYLLMSLWQTSRKDICQNCENSESNYGYATLMTYS